MILSILIPTLPDRKHLLDKLLFELRSQISACGQPIEVLVDRNAGSVGVKRQRLLQLAQGEYVVFIDDDDWVSLNYIKHLLTAFEERPDVVGFYGEMSTNGKHTKNFLISKNVDYTEDEKTYFRFNNHLSPVLRTIALQVGYKDMTFQEDYDYAVRLKESGLLQTEYFIYENLYHYRYVKKSYR